MAINTTNSITQGNTTTYSLNATKITGKEIKRGTQNVMCYGDDFLKIEEIHLTISNLEANTGTTVSGTATTVDGYEFITWVTSRSTRWEALTNITTWVQDKNVTVSVFNASNNTKLDTCDIWVDALYRKST